MGTYTLEDEMIQQYEDLMAKLLIQVHSGLVPEDVGEKMYLTLNTELEHWKSVKANFPPTFPPEL